MQLSLVQPSLQPAELDVHDLRDLLAAQRLEHHDLVHPVDELRAERGPDFCHDLLSPDLL
jgi:hypothetical protein